MSAVDGVKDEIFAQELTKAFNRYHASQVAERKKIRIRLVRLARREQRWYMKLLRKLQGKKYVGPSPEEIERSNFF